MSEATKWRQNDKLALADMFEVPAWRRGDVLAGLDGARRGPWTVIDLGSPVADALCDLLRARGDTVLAASRGDRHAAILERLRTAGEAGAPSRLVILTGAGGTTASLIPSSGRAAIGELVERLGDLGRGLAGHSGGWDLQLAIVTSGALAADGEAVQDPFAALVTGPCRALRAELPWTRCRHVDIPADLRDERDAELLAGELLSGREAVVALRRDGRFIYDFERPRLTEAVAGSPWRDGGSYLITGGLGGVGLVLAEDLVRRHGAAVTLTGRRGLPPRDRAASAAVRRMEALGAEVVVERADVADREAMTGVRDRMRRRYGDLDGIIHAAGVWPGPHDGLLEARTRPAAEAVLRAKVLGVLTLDAVFGDRPPALVVLCSSIASFSGGYGLADYAAGSAFLDAYARCPRRRLPNVVSVNWGGWQEVGMWAPHRDGAPGILNAEGPEALRRALAAGLTPQVVICPVPVSPSEPSPREGPARRTIAHDGDLVELLCRLWGEVLGRSAVGADEDFFALGGDSLGSVDLVWRIADVTGVKVSVRAVRDTPTPAALAGALASAGRR